MKIKQFIIKHLKKIIAVFLAVVIFAASVGTGVYYMKNLQPEKEISPLYSDARKILLSTFSETELGYKAKLKREINAENPLNIVNYYGSEDLVTFWNSIPDNQKPYSVLLIIPSHTLSPDNESELSYLEETADNCEKNHIPYAIQSISGETHFEERFPIDYLENRFASKHEYFYGLNCAELYNGVTWRGDNESNQSLYIIQSIELCAKYGAYFIWTDTNMNYESGMLLQWLETNESFYSAFKEYSDYICLLNKESFGDPSTYSVMEGLWLAGLVGNWGVSSDWWHWTCDGKKSLFGENDEYIDDEWDAILSYPENMYVQSMMLVMSRGGTCFKAEAPNFSTSCAGTAVGGFRYGIGALLDKILDGSIVIPSKQDVLDSTKAVVLGRDNYTEYNYNYEESNLYPATGCASIIPLLPSNLRLCERSIFLNNGIELLDSKMTEKEFNEYYGRTDDTAYLTKTADSYYYINSSENARMTQSASLSPVKCSAKSVTISSEEHTSAILTESESGIYFYLSNYRTDKTNMIKEVTPQSRDGKKWEEINAMYMPLGEDGSPIGLDDTSKRKTEIKIHGTKDGEKPTVELISSQDGTGYANRPFTISEKWDKESGTLTITVMHNGPVEFKVLLDKKSSTENTERTAIKETLIKNDNSTQELKNLTKTKVEDYYNYTYYSYLEYDAAFEKANVIISEGTYSKSEISRAVKNLEKAQKNLIPIEKYVTALKEIINKKSDDDSELTFFDSMIRELLSANIYVGGRGNDLEYSKIYKDSFGRYSTSKKLSALDEKYDSYKA